MRVREAQNLGALALLVASLAVYGGALIRGQQPVTESALPWGDQGPGMIAVEVTGTRGTDGIFFFPEGTDVANIVKGLGIEGAIEADGWATSDRTAILLSAAGRVVRIKEMSAPRRIALGLPIDLNRASAEDLSYVPGIGEKMAMQIVQRRQATGRFSDLSDLTTIPGIKEKKLNGVKRYLTIGLSDGQSE